MSRCQDRRSQKMTARFFAATVLRGCLHVDGVPERGPWDSSRLDRFTEYEIAPGLVMAARDRIAHTLTELIETLGAPTGHAPMRRIWIHESLEDGARRVWEKSPLTKGGLPK